MLCKQNLQNLIDGSQFRKVMNKHFPKIKSLCHQDIHIKIDKCGLKKLITNINECGLMKL